VVAIVRAVRTKIAFVTTEGCATASRVYVEEDDATATEDDRDAVRDLRALLNRDAVAEVLR
jgi:hypothetical protein